MNKKESTRFKKLILAERDRVVAQLDAIEEGINDRSSSQPIGAQGYSNHMADIGSDVMDQEQAFLHASQGSDYLRQLEEALKRVEDGTYGVCEECGGKIPAKRLEAALAAGLCVACKSKQEKLQRS